MLDLSTSLTALVGGNGTGKTAALLGLLRMFGMSDEDRRVRRSDFHVPPNEEEAPLTRSLAVEAILVFPELADPSGDHAAVPQFFQQMVIDDEGEMVVRFRLEATWTDEGSLNGAVTQRLRVVSTLDDEPSEEQLSFVSAHDRARIQVVYVPPNRAAAPRVTQFLRGRLWRAAQWSDSIRGRVQTAGEELDAVFSAEESVKSVTDALEARWTELHNAGTDSTPHFRALDHKFTDVVGRVGLFFEPAAGGGERRADELSEGQQSLLQIAMTTATLDIENAIARGEKTEAFSSERLALPALTIVAVEEPENSLAPYFLSRIVLQLQDLSAGIRAQSIISSHSSSVLRRVEPEDVRYFRLIPETGCSTLRKLALPTGADEQAKYVREAVRAYPELYFARAVVLGEGASEEIVLPALASSTGLAIDQSFVAVVPLGGRHVNHFWRLLSDLRIPHLTLLDLDSGRFGGGAGRVKYAVAQLIENGVDAQLVFPEATVDEGLAAFDTAAPENVQEWIGWLQTQRVFFSEPLDLDWSMLCAYEEHYTTLEEGMRGPRSTDSHVESVLGPGGDRAPYSGSEDLERMAWYRYLFLTRGKPATHLRVLSTIADEVLAAHMPESIGALLASLRELLE